MFAADGALTAAMLQKALGKEVVFKLICLGGWVRLGGKELEMYTCARGILLASFWKCMCLQVLL